MVKNYRPACVKGFEAAIFLLIDYPVVGIIF
jgi:hypothetical protein